MLRVPLQCLFQCYIQNFNDNIYIIVHWAEMGKTFKDFCVFLLLQKNKNVKISSFITYFVTIVGHRFMCSPFISRFPLSSKMLCSLANNVIIMVIAVRNVNDSALNNEMQVHVYLFYLRSGSRSFWMNGSKFVLTMTAGESRMP